MPKVAIIDDDSSTNDRIRDLLKNYPDIKITQELDGKSAEHTLSTEHFDIVILDIDLGDGPKGRHGGFDLLAGLRGKSTTTLVVSGMQEENLASISITLKAYDFIGKPFSDIDFINKFEHALEAQRGEPSTDEEAAALNWPKELEPDPRRVHGLKWKGKSIGLSITQSRLVHCLLQNIGKTVPTRKLVEQLKSANSSNVVASHLTAARKRFRDADPEFNCISNDPGMGYVWKNEE